MFQRVFADGVEIFRIEIVDKEVVRVDTINQINAVAGQEIQIQVFADAKMNITGLPANIGGDVPSSATFDLIIEAGVLPTGAFELEIGFSVTDADRPLEAAMYVNGEFVDNLWPGGHPRASDIVSVQKIIIPGILLVEGTNLCEIELIKNGSGFRIHDVPMPTIAILFDTKNPAVSPLLQQISAAFQELSEVL